VDNEKRPWLVKLGITVIARCKDREDARREMTDYKKERDGLVQYNLRLGRHLAVINEDFERCVHESLDRGIVNDPELGKQSDENIATELCDYDVDFESENTDDVVACVRTWKILRKEAQRAQAKPE
jgi:hypothetical protein